MSISLDKSLQRLAWLLTGFGVALALTVAMTSPNARAATQPTTANPQAPNPITSISIATGEYAPWTAEHSRYGGLVNRVVQEAFARKNVKVHFRYLPWKRALEETRIGAYDATSFWFNVRTYEKDFLLSDPISSHREVLFHLSNNPLPPWKTLDDLSAFTFGATRGYEYTSAFAEAARSGRLRVVEADTDETNFQRLLSRRIGVFPMDEVAAMELLSNKQKFPPASRAAITANATPLRTTTGHLLFPRTAPAAPRLLEVFNAGLAEMKADGTLEKYRQEMLRGAY